MKPSSTTTRRAKDPPSTTPASTPISNPPTLASTSRPSFGSGWFTCRARSTTAILCAISRSFRPVPCPVVSLGGLRVRAAAMALDAVVLPIPMSPVPMMSAPPSAASSAMLTPAITHTSACSLVMAGPLAMSAVPRPTPTTRRSGWAGSGVATPASTITRSTPAFRAMALIAAPPARKFNTIWAVTSCG